MKSILKHPIHLPTAASFLAIALGLCISLVLPVPVHAGETEDAESQLESMPLAGPGAHLLAAGESASMLIEVPGHDAEQGERLGVLAMEIYGTIGDGAGRVELKAVDAESREVIASGDADVTHEAEPAPWGVIFSSETRTHRAAMAFDGNPATFWQSQQRDGDEEWIGLEFQSPVRMAGLNYLPRSGRNAHGVAREFRLDIRRPGGDWESAATGQRRREPRSELEVALPEPMEVEAFRFVILQDWRRNGYGSAAGIGLPGLDVDLSPARASSHAWMEIPPEMMKRLGGKSFELWVRNPSAQAVVIGAPLPHFSLVPPKPDRGMIGRPGRSGPNQIGAGLLGFNALSVHQQSALPVMNVRDDTAAARQGLRQGDVIVAVGGRPLPVNPLTPGWAWFRDSHEAILGREIEAALEAGDSQLALTLLREGAVEEIHLPLDREAAFTTLNPADDPEAARMLEDLIDFLVRTQRDNGSWSRCMIRTSLSALALLATGDAEHHERVEKAVEWTMRRYPDTDAFGRLGFWPASYAGLLLTEWHLATGEGDLLPVFEAIRDWTVDGAVETRWEVLGLGHTPGGMPYQQRGLVAPACHLLVFEALAMRAGMESGIWELLMPYMEMSWSDPAEDGHGALGYNPSFKDNREFWSRTGLFAMAAHLRGERTDMRDAMIRVMHERHPWFRNSHAYGEPGGALGLLALNLVSPEIFAEVIGEYTWSFSLAWEPGHGLRYTSPHWGSRAMGQEDLINAAYALMLQAPQRTLHLTGREP